MESITYRDSGTSSTQIYLSLHYYHFEWYYLAKAWQKAGIYD